MAEGDQTKWDSIYRGQLNLAPVSPFLLQIAEHLPSTGCALDFAGGHGRHALWLAKRGLEVTIADVSQTGLNAARAHAHSAHLHINTQRIDLEREELPKGPWDVIIDHYFLWRPLFARLPDLLNPGGVFIFCQPTIKNLERHSRPSRRFLLGEDELDVLINDAQRACHLGKISVLWRRQRWSNQAGANQETQARHQAELVLQLPHIA